MMQIASSSSSSYIRHDGYFDDYGLIRDIGRAIEFAHLTKREKYETYLRMRHECGTPIGLLADTGNYPATKTNQGDSSMQFNPGKINLNYWPDEDNDVRMAKCIIGRFCPHVKVVGDNCFRVRLRDGNWSSLFPSPLPKTSPFIREEASLFDYKYREKYFEGPLTDIRNAATLVSLFNEGGKSVRRIRFLNDTMTYRDGGGGYCVRRQNDQQGYVLRFFVLFDPSVVVYAHENMLRCDND